MSHLVSENIPIDFLAMQISFPCTSLAKGFGANPYEAFFKKLVFKIFMKEHLKTIHSFFILKKEKTKI